ncbi:hypothetical protein T11_11650 [Trichinella zimbabwensis]|uniref:Uncharacterized protein n=1 Tax=Trichinella zimbabwensis TaxID=268475 RepID=A0A0V1HRV4_9BILA|nr:hypothetical protein T11_11650 [Trichinella zimbabwensis]
MRKDAKLKTSKNIIEKTLQIWKENKNDALIENSTDGRKRLRLIIEKRKISITWMQMLLIHNSYYYKSHDEINIT